MDSRAKLKPAPRTRRGAFAGGGRAATPLRAATVPGWAADCSYFLRSTKRGETARIVGESSSARRIRERARASERPRGAAGNGTRPNTAPRYSVGGLSEFKFAGSAAFARKNKLLLEGKRLLQSLLGGE